jgi:hypothetical protein
MIHHDFRHEVDEALDTFVHALDTSLTALPLHSPGMDNPDERKKALLRGFFELARRGLIEHDWSEAAETGVVKVRVKWEDIKSSSRSGH